MCVYVYIYIYVYCRDMYIISYHNISYDIVLLAGLEFFAVDEGLAGLRPVRLLRVSISEGLTQANS